MNKHVALITAKGNNSTLANKNLAFINGKPSIEWQITAASRSQLISEIFVTTECPLIKEFSISKGAKIIDRPDFLAKPNTNHGDVILHGYEKIKMQLEDRIDTLTVLLGNTAQTTATDIDSCIKKLLSYEEASGCMTVWKAQDDHPYRAMTLGEDGYLKSFLELGSIDTNRQSYPEIYFYDQGPWTVKGDVLNTVTQTSRDNLQPWWWMGDKCMAIERLWVTGRDTHTEIDIVMAEAWLNTYGVD